jgi:hypothetical protein
MFMNDKIKVITVDKDHTEFFKYCEIVEEFADSLPNDMKKIKNYRADLKIKESIAVSLYQTTNGIIGFSSVLHRDLFGNGVRVLNRLVKSYDYRFLNRKGIMTAETKLMIEQQVEVAKKYHFDYVFISRESNKDVSSLSRYFENLKGWHCPDKRYRVCNGEKSCEQYVAWFPLKKDITLPLIII